jgi:hypothetical protein
VTTLDDFDSLLTSPEAAKLLRLSQRTLERFRTVGCGPRFRVLGRAVRFGSDVQTAVTQLDALEFAAPQLAGKAFQPPVEFGAAPGRTKRLCEPTIIN